MSEPSSDPAAVSLLAEYRGRGGLLSELVGPGPEPGTEWIYQSRVYIGGTLQIVGIDPRTGEHRAYEPGWAGEAGAWAVAVGSDENLYVGTLPGAHLLRLDPRSGTVTDLGQPATGEKYFWEAVAAADGRIYFGTYPSARLVCLDPATGRAEDLGRVDPVQQYARHLASGDGFVYVGVGSARMGLVALHLASGRRRNILPAELARPGFVVVRQAASGAVYAAAGRIRFRVRGWSLERVRAADIPAEVRVRLRAGQRDQPRRHRLQDGRRVLVTGSTITTSRPGAARREVAFRYAGRELSVYRLGIGPDRRLYGSTVLPLQFFSLDPIDRRLTSFGELGSGEVYSFLTWRNTLLAAAYGGPAPLFIYDPGQPYTPGLNPRLVEFAGQERSWRPLAMAAEPGPRPARVFIGAIGGYGTIGGPLTEWWPDQNRVVTRPDVVPAQCVVSLAASSRLLYGGTTVAGGPGSVARPGEAVVFGWDPLTAGKTFELVPVPGATEVTGLVVAGDRLLGIADQATLFAIDLTSHTPVATAPLPFRGVIPNALAADAQGRLWGLAPAGVFAVDAARLEARVVVPAPEPVTAGFALHGGCLYFGSGPRLYSVRLPK